MFEIEEPAQGVFAPAMVNGLVPGQGLTHASALQATLAEFAVVCLRLDRALEKSEFASVAELFGAIKDPIGRAKDGSAFRYSKSLQVIDAGFVMTEEIRRERGDLNFGGLDDERPGLFETYHCDDTYTEDPAQATILHARALPPSGGGPTHFIDMRAAFEQLDAATKERLERLRVVYAYNNEDAFPPRRSASGAADVLIDVSHPLVRDHPAAQTRALFIDLDRAKSIEGMQLAAGRVLLQALQDHAEANAPTCHHEWQEHDVLVWDNASVQHKAEGNFKLGEPRRFWRHMISGPSPR